MLDSYAIVVKGRAFSHMTGLIHFHLNPFFSSKLYLFMIDFTFSVGFYSKSFEFESVCLYFSLVASI